MGVTMLWQLLKAEEVVEHYKGGESRDVKALVAAVDGKALAVDLSTWLMQADQQVALLPHFSKEERCMKVAFERAVQWLRHGCLPVVVVEGRPPHEKIAAQQARFAARNGYAGGGGQAGAAQFQRLGQTVGKLLEELGLPVFYAPGEAEASCAALNRAGCVDGCASPDSDTLLYGAEAVYHTLKLQTSLPRECELKRVRMASIRQRLGLTQGGAKALCVLAMMAGSDYDLDGAQGVGSVGGLALARHLLQGDPSDAGVLERLATLVQSPTQQHLLDLTKCTGCSSCGHEGGRAGKIKRHSKQNPCTCCPANEDGACRAVAFERCRCAFHRLETERKVEKILERVRKMPDFLADAQAAAAVFERQGAEAEVYVRQRLAQLGGRAGERLHWLHRPRVQGVFGIIQAKRRQLLWDLPDIRSKLLPVLLEWDMQRQAAESGCDEEGSSDEVEFRAAEIQKVHGQKSRTDPRTGAHWRYVVRWERLDSDLEGLDRLEVHAKKPRAKAGSSAAAAAGGGDDDEEEGVGTAALLTQAGSREGKVEVLSLRDFDLRWMKEQPAEHRAVRISAVRHLLPQLERQHQLRVSGGGGGSGGGKQVDASGTKKSGASVGAGGKKPRAGEQAARRTRQLLPEVEEQQQQQQQRPAPRQKQQGDLTQHLVQRRAGEQPARPKPGTADAGASANAGSGRGYGLGGGPSARQWNQQQLLQQRHLPATPADMRDLLNRVLDSPPPAAAAAAAGWQGREQAQVRRRQHSPPAQHASPEKKPRSPLRHGVPVAAAAGAAAGAGPPGSPEFEVLLSSPESPAFTRRQQAEEGEDGSSPLPLAARWLEGGRGLQQQAQQQQQSPGRQPQRQPVRLFDKRASSGSGGRGRAPGSAGRDIRTFFSRTPAAAAAGVAAAAGAAGVAAVPPGVDVVNLVTPTRVLPASNAPAALHAGAGAQVLGRLGPARQQQQRKPALLGSPDIDLTQDD